MSLAPHNMTTSQVTVLSETVDQGSSDEPTPITLTRDRLLTAQAMRLLIHLDRDLREARAQFNQDWFRRVVRTRRKAVTRLRRRWAKISPPPQIPLGNLRRRYHANLTNYLYLPDNRTR